MKPVDLLAAADAGRFEATLFRRGTREWLGIDKKVRENSAKFRLGHSDIGRRVETFALCPLAVIVADSALHPLQGPSASYRAFIEVLSDIQPQLRQLRTQSNDRTTVGLQGDDQ